MTGRVGPVGHRPALIVVLGLAAGIAAGATEALSAEQSYPFEGTWVRADRVCSATAPSARTYTAREITSSGGRCTIRKIAFGSGEWEIFEDCHRAERSGNVVEKIRMYGPDSMLLKFQANRLKIPRGRRFARCTAAAKPVPSTGRPSPLPAPGIKPGRPGPVRDPE